MTITDLRFLIIPTVVFFLSSAATGLAICYARRRQLIDQPGRRRSHDAPTPRGGGVGIVVAVVIPLMAALAIASTWTDRRFISSILFGTLVVAFAGWLDDHRPLGVLPRLAAHLFAALLFAVALIYPASSWIVGLAIATIVVSVVWSINLHNFMDGIDGLLASQALFVFCAFGAIAYVGDAGDFALDVVVASAVAGFLPWNAPRAKIFMGDVGSGALGFLVAAAAWLGILRGALTVAAALIVCSAFVIDATCTLLSRMLRGRRWYSAHREHLYQWLVRAGFSHARVVALYMGWNVLIVLPTLLWINRPSAATNGVAQAVAVFALGVAAWWFGKRWCLRRVAAGGAHAAA